MLWIFHIISYLINGHQLKQINIFWIAAMFFLICKLIGTFTLLINNLKIIIRRLTSKLLIVCIVDN